MHLRSTTVLALNTLAVLALAGCSNNRAVATDPTSSTPSRAHQGSKNTPPPTPLSSAALNKRLLQESDLGEEYTLKPKTTERHDDVT